jgi:phosphatidylglycerophosphate synthase
MDVSTATTTQHVRVHGSVLAAVERRVLVWLAHRMPPGVSSDHLSALSLAALAGAGLSFAAFRWTPWAALGVIVSLAANWFGDSLDGTLARVRRQERPRYGYYVDHAIDMAGSTLLVAGIACSPLMSPVAAMALLAAFLLVSAEAFLATHTVGVFRLSFLGVGPTELRIALAAGALQAARSPVLVIEGTSWRLFDAAAIAATIGLLAVFIASAVRNARTLYRAETNRP